MNHYSHGHSLPATRRAPLTDSNEKGRTISVVTSLYKSESYIDAFHERCVAAIHACGLERYQIIFVEDCGPGNDLEVARKVAERDPNVLVVELARNVGQHPATMEGLSHATGDFICIMDSDLEEKPEWITLFFEEMKRVGSDVVYGVSDEKSKSLFYSSMRSFFYVILNFLAPVQFPKNVCTARLMTKDYVKALLRFEERELFMAGIWHVVGFKQSPVRVVKEDSSPTTYSLGRLAAFFVNGVTAFSTRPLMLISILGMVLSLVAFAYLLLIVGRKMLVGIDVEGWASVMAAVLLVGGVTLFVNGIIAIYIAKIFIEVKRRPRSIVKAVHGAGSAGE
jgi:putative glycosyltransferase